jgi:hypothetical protein
MGCIKWDAPSKVPVLHTGDITPTVMHEYKDACQGYFDTKEIAEDKQVCQIFAGIKDTASETRSLSNAWKFMPSLLKHL